MHLPHTRRRQSRDGIVAGLDGHGRGQTVLPRDRHQDLVETRFRPHQIRRGGDETHRSRAPLDRRSITDR